MPELPDLQVFSHNLDKALSGKKLKVIKLENTKKAKDTPAAFKKALEGETLESVYREGKELRFRFKNEAVLGMHLMLHGKLYYFEEENTNKHTVIALLFEDGKGLALTDFQGAAVPSLNPEAAAAPDALSKEFTLTFLKEQLAKKKTAVKKILLDQHIIRGIGNAYADEILWEAGISPFSIANKIPATKVKALHAAIHNVLKEAEKQIRKEHPDIIAGEIRDFMKIHQPKKTHSPTGGVIEQQELNSRKTYYTNEQELFE
ncbi:Fpg/Nei family DNA glycosylase [Chitinophaga pinensis]|uniref:DNA-formamidopyrimidine glycosylase n=1 Tax=Chitinophaga pinensis (strain ATCC 43595 / DSM 2588 / LMG 13176 / NBRC 15968 / NCIMB 11800 / UQM 2034) TaxID=485918 RepID=A0A979GAP4_CHIPD|nr:DNA-formamidopyrimidine glycosylase family protein [Chitinophaga pinensis]ACU63898.1 DNA-formamidopyrimidine glycosylase [Chitinophaga pinensis DSM 2588]